MIEARFGEERRDRDLDVSDFIAVATVVFVDLMAQLNHRGGNSLFVRFATLKITAKKKTDDNKNNVEETSESQKCKVDAFAANLGTNVTIQKQSIHVSPAPLT